MKKLFLCTIILTWVTVQTQLAQNSSQDTSAMNSIIQQNKKQSAQLAVYASRIDSLEKALADHNQKGNNHGDKQASPDHNSHVDYYNWTTIPKREEFGSPKDGKIPGSDGWILDSHYAGFSVLKVIDNPIREAGSKTLQLTVDALNPPPANGAPGNYRAEVALGPWHKAGPLKTEYWYGFSYYIPIDWKDDPTTEMTLMQLHVGQGGPPVMIWKSGNNKTNNQLLMTVAHGTNFFSQKDRFSYSGVYFKPDRWYDFVVHVIWDTESGGDGLVEWWINGRKIDKIIGGNDWDVPDDSNGIPYPGTLKLGLYVYSWRKGEAIEASKNAGVTKNTICLGPVRVYKGSDGYDLVKPRN